MPCGCKKDINIIRGRAEQLSFRLHQDVQIYSFMENNETYYGYEILNPHRESIVEIIKYSAI